MVLKAHKGCRQQDGVCARSGGFVTHTIRFVHRGAKSSPQQAANPKATSWTKQRLLLVKPNPHAGQNFY